MVDDRTLMLLSGAHPVHRRFGEYACDEVFQLPELASKGQAAPTKALSLLRASLAVPSGFSHIVCESCYFYPAMKRRMGLLGKSKIINLGCGPLFLHLLSGRIKGFERKALLELLRDVDGHLVYGTYGLELLSRLEAQGRKNPKPETRNPQNQQNPKNIPASSRPVRVVYPFVKEESMRKLVSLKPALEDPTILIIVSSDPFNKGLDLLFKAFATVLEHEPKARLRIVSRVEPAGISSIQGYGPARMSILGNVPDISQEFASSSLYIQPSRGDMFPVACIEAMAAGVPTIVSKENGAKEIVDKIGPGMVVDDEAKSIADAVLSYFSKSMKERMECSSRCRAAASFFNEKDMLALFKRQLAGLKEEI